MSVGALDLDHCGGCDVLTNDATTCAVCMTFGDDSPYCGTCTVKCPDCGERVCYDHAGTRTNRCDSCRRRDDFLTGDQA